MNHRNAIRALGALAHEHRLSIYRHLVRQGREGLPAGAIGSRVGLAPSSLTFHLQALQQAGLVRQARVSRQLFYSADFRAVTDLIGYLTEECCAASAACAPSCESGPAGRKPGSAKAA